MKIDQEQGRRVLFISRAVTAAAWLLLVGGSAVGSAAAADGPLDGWLRRSQVALMPEGEPESVAVLKPLGAEVVAWGADAVHYLNRPEAYRERMQAYRELGVQLLACNVWMLTATPRVLHADPRFQDAVCVDIDGTRIIPRWLDGSYQGVPSYWGCTNHPLFRAQLIARAQTGIAAGANLLHLDDHMGTAAAAEHSGGCFCADCATGFAQWLEANRSAEERTQLGLPADQPFDYPTFLRAAGLSSRALYDAALREQRVPLRAEFLMFQREAAVAFVRELAAVAAATAGRPVPVGVNSWNLAPTQLATAHAADYFSNEISHYGVEDLEAPRAYLLADVLRKPVFSTGTGEDWIEVMQHGDVTRVRRWIATAHAFGHHFMYAYRKWGFSEATGTQWYQTPIETYAPLYQFITSHPSLFDHYEAAPQVGVLYDNRSRRAGRADVGPIVRALHDAHYSVGLAVAGDEWLQHELDEAQLERFELLIVPTGVQLAAPAAAVLERWRNDGGTVLEWTDVEAVQARLEPRVQVRSSGRVWALSRVRNDLGPARTVVHLLNQQAATDGDAMMPSGPVQLALRTDRWVNRRPKTATLHAPDQPPLTLPIDYVGDRGVVTVPSVDVWAVLALE
jgi:hypothetical protein